MVRPIPAGTPPSPQPEPRGGSGEKQGGTHDGERRERFTAGRRSARHLHRHGGRGRICRCGRRACCCGCRRGRRRFRSRRRFHRRVINLGVSRSLSNHCHLSDGRRLVPGGLRRKVARPGNLRALNGSGHLDYRRGRGRRLGRCGRGRGSRRRGGRNPRLLHGTGRRGRVRRRRVRRVHNRRRRGLHRNLPVAGVIAVPDPVGHPADVVGLRRSRHQHHGARGKHGGGSAPQRFHPQDSFPPKLRLHAAVLRSYRTLGTGLSSRFRQLFSPVEKTPSVRPPGFLQCPHTPERGTS